MNSCSITGSCDRASQPMAEETTGTSRHPSICWPSAATIASSVRWQISRGPRPGAGKRMPRRSRRQPATAPTGSVVGSKERIRQLHQDPRTIARVLIAAARSAMLEVPEDLQPAQNGRVALPAAEVGHEPDAARVSLEGRVVESLVRSGGRCDASRFIAVRHEAYSLTVPAPDQSSMHLPVIEQSCGEHEPEIDL